VAFSHLLKAGDGKDKTAFHRDSLDRLIKKISKDDTSEYHYDPLSRLTLAKNAHSELAFAYDRDGQLMEESQNGSLIE